MSIQVQQWRVTILDFKKDLLQVFTSRQTFSLIFLWILTWFLYGLFMKAQVNALNVGGAVIFATLIVLSYFIPPPKVIVTQKIASPQSKKTSSTSQLDSLNTSTKSLSNLKIEESVGLSQVKQTLKENSFHSGELKSQPSQTSNENPETPKPNGCPKNLPYYTMKPRPKQTPTECFSCENLISCVCLTRD